MLHNSLMKKSVLNFCISDWQKRGFANPPKCYAISNRAALRARRPGAYSVFCITLIMTYHGREVVFDKSAGTLSCSGKAIPLGLDIADLNYIEKKFVEYASTIGASDKELPMTQIISIILQKVSDPDVKKALRKEYFNQLD